jgi:hypothetical protein
VKKLRHHEPNQGGVDNAPARAIGAAGFARRLAWHLTTRLWPIRTRPANDNLAYGEDGRPGEADRSAIGILLDPVVVGLQVTDRHDREEFPAFGLLLPSLCRTLSEDR